jgi:Tfp pilus assembly ATPase PilU
MSKTANRPWHPLGELAVELEHLSNDQLERMLMEQATMERHLPLGELLRRFGLLRQSQLDALLALQASRRSGAFGEAEEDPRPVEYRLVADDGDDGEREVGRDSASYASGLRAALRQDPDVLVVGDLTAQEVIVAALNAAETGHLVIGMMPTRDVTSTLDRLISTFPPRSRKQARGMLAQSLRGILTQRLMPHIRGGLVPVVELLFNTPAVANLIREGHTHMVPNVIKTGRRHGMYRFEDSVAELRRRGLLGGAR